MTLRASSVNGSTITPSGITASGNIITSGFIRAGALGSPLSTLETTGSFGANITTLSGDTTLTSTHYTVLVDATAGAIVITLPTVSTSNRRIYNIKKIDASANTVTIDGNGAEVIDGALTQVLATQWSALQMQNNSTAWYILAKN